MSDDWTDAYDLEFLVPGDVTAVKVGDKELALYEVDGEVYASDNRCTHGDALLSDGFLEGTQIECPFHQGRFDVCTGKALCAPLTQDIRVYPVRIENKRILEKLRSVQERTKYVKRTGTPGRLAQRLCAGFTRFELGALVAEFAWGVAAHNPHTSYPAHALAL